MTEDARIANRRIGVAYVGGIALTTSRADPLAELLAASDAITGGELDRVCAGADDGRRRLEIQLVSVSVADRPCAVLKGRQTTRDGDEGTGADSRGLQPARAIRRALADAAVKAAEVDAVFACYVESSNAGARDRATASITLAFGRYADGIAVDLHRAVADGHMSAALACARCVRAIASGQIGVGVVVAIGVGGTNSAVVFSRA